MKKQEIIDEVLEGKIFVYPTDTIYGIGCNALQKKTVEKIREIKKRDSKPFSVIAPSFEWIIDNLVIDCNLDEYLPGPYTIILKKKNPDFLKWVSDSDALGIRVPKNDFCFEVQKSGVPFITTSVNISGEKPITKISDIPLEIRKNVDFIIDAGELTGKPSTLVINGKKIQRA